MAVAPKNTNQMAEEMNKEYESKIEFPNKNILPEVKHNRTKSLVSNSIYSCFINRIGRRKLYEVCLYKSLFE